MISIERKLQKTVRLYLKNHRVPENAPILAAFSGGPDSVAMVSLLLSLRRSGRIVPAYFDHGIRSREELEEEKNLVTTFAGDHGLPLHTGGVAPGLLEEEAGRKGLSVEDLARDYRYGYLQDTAREAGCDYIAFGHNLDDQLETMIIRVFQGSGPAGLKGMPEKRDNIIRPLIGIEKGEILRYLGEKHLEYSLDSTNGEDSYLRNRVRHDLVPAVKKIFPGYKKSLGIFTEKMRLADDLIRERTDALLRWDAFGCGYRISTEDFYSAPPITRLQSLYDLFDRCSLSPDRARVPFGALKPSLSEPGEGDGVIFRWNGYVLVRREAHIFWERDIVFRGKKQYLIVVDKDVDVMVDEQVFHVRLCSEASEGGMFNIRAAAPPLIIRSKKAGDRLRLAGGRTELKKLFSEWNVRSSHRGIIPVLEDREGIVAVLGEHLGYKNRYRTRNDDTCDCTNYKIRIEVIPDG